MTKAIRSDVIKFRFVEIIFYSFSASIDQHIYNCFAYWRSVNFHQLELKIGFETPPNIYTYCSHYKTSLKKKILTFKNKIRLH